MKVPWWLWVVGGLAVLGGLLAPFASSLPDGLESVIERERIPVAESPQPSPLPDYQTPGVRNEQLSTLIAAAAGVALVALATLAIGRLLARRRPTAGSEAREEP